MAKTIAPRASSPKLKPASQPRVTPHVLKEITCHVVAAVQPEKVILFGSYAYGKPKRDSDVDLLVIMESDKSVFERHHIVRGALHDPDLPAMDILVRTPAEIERRLEIGDFFIYEILEKGRVLYAAQDDQRAAR